MLPESPPNNLPSPVFFSVAPELDGSFDAVFVHESVVVFFALSVEVPTAADEFAPLDVPNPLESRGLENEFAIGLFEGTELLIVESVACEKPSRAANDLESGYSFTNPSTVT